MSKKVQGILFTWIGQTLSSKIVKLFSRPFGGFPMLDFNLHQNEMEYLC